MVSFTSFKPAVSTNVAGMGISRGLGRFGGLKGAYKGISGDYLEAHGTS